LDLAGLERDFRAGDFATFRFLIGFRGAAAGFDFFRGLAAFSWLTAALTSGAISFEALAMVAAARPT